MPEYSIFADPTPIRHQAIMLLALKDYNRDLVSSDLADQANNPYGDGKFTSDQLADMLRDQLARMAMDTGQAAVIYSRFLLTHTKPYDWRTSVKAETEADVDVEVEADSAVQPVFRRHRSRVRQEPLLLTNPVFVPEQPASHAIPTSQQRTRIIGGDLTPEDLDNIYGAPKRPASHAIPTSQQRTRIIGWDADYD